MSNLIKLSDSQSSEFDFNQISDVKQRLAAIQICNDRDATYELLRDEATGILKKNTVNLAETVHQLKENLDHGNFSTVCQGKYNLNKQKQAALAFVGNALLSGTETDAALEMISEMEARAAQQFLKADEETKSSHVATFQQTGKVPSRRDYEYAQRANQQKRLEQNQHDLYIEAFSDNLEGSVYGTTSEAESVVNVEVAVIESEPTELCSSTEVTLSAVQDLLHQYLKVHKPLTEQDYSKLSVIRSTIANYSNGRFPN